MSSRYISGLIRKIEAKLEPFKSRITRTMSDTHNNQGYGYLTSGRSNIHILSDNTYIEEGLMFDPAKAATVAYFHHRSDVGDLITEQNQQHENNTEEL